MPLIFQYCHRVGFYTTTTTFQLLLYLVTTTIILHSGPLYHLIYPPDHALQEYSRATSSCSFPVVDLKGRYTATSDQHYLHRTTRISQQRSSPAQWPSLLPSQIHTISVLPATDTATSLTISPLSEFRRCCCYFESNESNPVPVPSLNPVPVSRMTHLPIT